MKFLSILIYLLIFCAVSQAQIHRATSPTSYQIRYNSNFSFQYFLKKIDHRFSNYPENVLNQELIIWITSVIGTFFVGICGVLPVLMLPNLADNHHKLGMKKYESKTKLTFSSKLKQMNSNVVYRLQLVPCLEMCLYIFYLRPIQLIF